MLTRALAQNLAVIGMLATLQEVRRIGWDCECRYECFCARNCEDTAYDAMKALGEQCGDENESATHREVYG